MFRMVENKIFSNVYLFDLKKFIIIVMKTFHSVIILQPSDSTIIVFSA